MKCNCEKEETQNTPTSIHNCGPIKNSERILLAGVHPMNYRNGELLKSCFDDKKLKKENVSENISVCRADFSTREEVHSQIVDPLVAKDETRTLEAVFLVEAVQIRTIEANGTGIKAFCVIDDGKVDFPSHAALRFSDAIRQDNKFWNNANKNPNRSNPRSTKEATINNLLLLFQSGKCDLNDVFGSK